MPRCTTFDLLTQDCTSSPSNLTLTEAPGKKCGHLGTWTVSTWSFLPLWKLQRLFQLIWLFKRWSDCVFFVSFFLNIFYSGSLWSCSCLHSFTSSQSSRHWIKSWVKAYTNHHLSLWALVGLINIKKRKYFLHRIYCMIRYLKQVLFMKCYLSTFLFGFWHVSDLVPRQ